MDKHDYQLLLAVKAIAPATPDEPIKAKRELSNQVETITHQ